MALVVTTAMAGSNALYGQRHAHPAPLFAPFAAAPAVAPVIPLTRPKTFGTKSKLVVGKPVALKASPDTAAAGPIGNADVIEVQRKLEMLKLFSGKIDGFYGPQTARAIKKFEELNGLKPKGELTIGMVELVRKAPLSLAEPKEQPTALTIEQPAVEAAPETVVLPKKLSVPVETDLPAALPANTGVRVRPDSLAALKPLDEPKPLAMEIETGSIAKAEKPAAATLLGRPVPETPEAALEMAAETAGDAIDTIISGVETVAMTKPGKRVAAVQQFVSEVASLGPAETAAPLELPADKAVADLAALPEKPQVGVPLNLEEAPAKPGEAIAVLDTPATPDEIMRPASVSDPVFVAKVQRGLASLGFLHGPADGVAGEATAKAIRNFETYFNYDTTGRISPELLDLLIENGAVI
jgi:peptidoglycan hydrolase-like protein with peptidoglycan-binding domain